MKIKFRSILLFISLIFILGCGETRNAFYNNLDEARKDGAIQRGRIPSILPSSSHEIYERHNIDNNMVWMRFRFDKKDIKELLQQLKEIGSAGKDEIDFRRPGYVGWWPRYIDKEFFKMKGNRSHLKIYRYDEIIKYRSGREEVIPAYFVIDVDSSIAYYWLSSS